MRKKRMRKFTPSLRLILGWDWNIALVAQIQSLCTWRQPKCLLMDEWVKKIWSIFRNIYTYTSSCTNHVHPVYIVEYLSIIKKKEILPFATTCMNLENPEVIMLKKKTNTVYACVLSLFSHVWLFVALWTLAHQAPLSMRFSRQEY